MSSEVLSQQLQANVQATFGAGRIFNILSAPGGPLTVIAERKSQAGGQTAVRKFVNIPAGAKFTAPAGDEWTYLRITSAVAQTISIFVGDEDMTFSNAVTVQGTAQVEELPAGALADTADTALAAGATAVIPANLNRRWIWIGCNLTNANPIRVSAAGAAGSGVQIQPGMYEKFANTGALTVRNDSAGATSYYAEEAS